MWEYTTRAVTTSGADQVYEPAGSLGAIPVDLTEILRQHRFQHRAVVNISSRNRNRAYQPCRRISDHKHLERF